MRKTTILLLLISFLTSCTETEAEPGIIANSIIGKDVGQLSDQYKASMSDEPCAEDDKLACEKVHKACACKKITIAAYANIRRELFFSVASDKVVSVFETWTTGEQLYKKMLPKAGEILGANPPTKVMSIDSSQSHFQYYTAFWEYESGALMAQLVCPKSLANPGAYGGSLSECLLRKYWIKHHKDYSKKLTDLFEPNKQVTFSY